VSNQTASPEALSEFLALASPAWREAGSEGDSPQVRELLQWHALYRALTEAFPGIELTPDLMTIICEESDIGGGFLSCTEMSCGGWVGDDADARAAAILGRAGQLEAVLVGCTFLAHGFDVWGGDGRPLLDEYRYLLPAVASYFSADSDVRLGELRLPRGWWDFDGFGPQPIGPNLVTYALNPRMTPQRRRGAVGAGPGRADVGIFGPTARLLSVDLSFLTPDELAATEATLSRLVEDLGLENPPEDPMAYEEYQLQPMNLGYLVGTFADSLLDDIPQSPGRLAASSLTPSTWVGAWGSQDVMDPDLWPYGPFRDAIAQSPWWA